ncbi:MAG: hypothetical protein DI564_13450 [Rhodanobacter denitrificans]|uniref:Right handed beta helix domain-containing protein n=1 Tax=Rhodanobacter denitrificans TaxID=666685 RepID=A0A2W5KA13_9GAMM|nr:MAG: hypothetical protein DI564_13450 [Rhodanobacter denitrificans]
MRLILAAALIPAVSADAAIFTVGSPSGPGQPCTHGTIQSAINAANANPGFDTIRLTRSLSYEPEANVVVTSQDLNIVGGFASCSQTDSDGIRTVVSGGLTGTQPVLSITANGSAIVKLRHLEIRRSPTRGIAFSGNGILQVIESTVTLNRGGGITATATGSNAELVLDTGTLVTFNNGSGVALAGPIEMTMIAPQTMIAYNVSGSSGGGLFVGAGAHAYIGSPGYSGLPAIYANEAVSLGGGIYNQGTLKLFATQSSRPVGVVGNTASWGAGIESPGVTCAWDFRIDDNAGWRGPAVHASGAVIMNKDNFAKCTPHPAAVRCTAGASCNSVSGNTSEDPDGAGAIHLDDGYFSADRIRMRDNRARFVVYGRDSDINLTNCLIVDNLADDTLLAAEGDATIGNALTVSGCTLARNAIGAHTLYSTNQLSVAQSIIDQPGRDVRGPASGYAASHLIVADLSGLPIHHTIMQADPLFIAPDAGDYRLRFLSPAVDWAPTDSLTTLDLVGSPRTVDLTHQANDYGPRDLGAFERQHGPWDCGAGDAVFCDSFDFK